MSTRLVIPISALFTVALLTTVPEPLQAATVGSDGGVTLWVSYDDSSSGPLDIDDTVDVTDATAGASCNPTNNARSANGAAASPAQCPAGASSCTGREKVSGDIQRFAEYVWQSTEGATHIRRVYVADEGRSWDTSDIQWNMNSAGSTAGVSGWKITDRVIRLRSSARSCIHDVLHHEFGHYFHRLPDRYARSGDYYRGRFGGGGVFDVDGTVADPNSVMNANFPHRFNDTTNASLTLDYTAPGALPTVGEVLTPALLADSDPANDGPDRAHHTFTEPFAQDDWTTMPGEHAHLAGIHAEGTFDGPDIASMPLVDIEFLDGSMPLPGTVLLLDRSGSMGVQTDGVPASQYVQEAGLYLYHSALSSDFVGTYLYNGSVEELFEYAVYDPTNQLPQASFRDAQGATNIADALETGIDELLAEHGAGGVNGAQIVLMSDGRQTVGPDLWTEVERANTLGIRINTFSFGDADATTMQQIASDTGGGNTEVSEREDAFELKLSMAHEFGDIRGFTPVHSFKGPLKRTERRGRVEYAEGRFVVPRHSRDLSFYSFLEGGNAALYDIELIDPTGSVSLVQADDIAERGRFNGIKRQKPMEGEWRYRILGTAKTDFVLPTGQPFELTAHVRNPTLDASLSVVGPGSLAGTVKVTGQVDFRYPMTDVGAVLHVYRDGQRRGAIRLFDDGVNGDDDAARDGVYTGLLDLSRFGLDRPLDGKRSGKTRLDAQFLIGKPSTPAPNAHYETGTVIKALAEDYEINGRGKLPFEAWATRTVDLSRRDDQQDRGGLKLLDPASPLKLRPGDTGQMVVQLLGFVPSRAQLRVGLGRSVKARIDEVRPLGNDAGATIKLSYAVAKDAGVGARTLRLQQGATQLRRLAAISVTP